MSILNGKKIVYDGDSICESAKRNEGAYPALIADLTDSAYVNLAVGGGTLASQKERPDTPWGGKYHSVVDGLDRLPRNGDLYCFEGGANDYWQNFELGAFDPRDLDSALDVNTVSGALEYILRYAQREFLGKPICFVIVHKISEYDKNTGARTADLRSKKNTAAVPYDFDELHDRLAAICKKYSIPYYDAYLESGLDAHNAHQNDAFLTAGDNRAPGHGDGCHPNAQGYKRYYVPQLISLFERIMPR